VVYITEGEKKAMALSQLGLAAIGLGGVWCGVEKESGELIPDLQAISWTGRTVVIVFDYDPKLETRADVAEAARRLRSALEIAGTGLVAVLSLPEGEGGTKQGVDDFLVRHGERAFYELERITLINLISSAAPHGALGGIRLINLISSGLPDPAYHGLTGDFLRTFSKHTEASDAALLAHWLPAVGMIIGPDTYAYAGGNQPARVNTVLVGPTNRGRKGTARSIVDSLFQAVDEDLWREQRVTGLSSGEGVIVKVEDIYATDPDTGERELVKEAEKRVLVVESEFSRVLANMKREGNILSQIIRECFDTGDLATLTIKPRTVSGAHISIVCHITQEDLDKHLTDTDMANGFGNRFLWFGIRSTKLLPHLKPIPASVFEPFTKRLRSLHHKGERYVPLAARANERWDSIYRELSIDSPGLAGAMIARGSTMVMRLALIYALLDGAKSIDVPHLEAALVVWRYCEASARLLFANKQGSSVAERILQLLRSGPMKGGQFYSHIMPDKHGQIPPSLERLEMEGLIRKLSVPRQGPGRPAVVWELVRASGQN
jgi:hypothetical protein